VGKSVEIKRAIAELVDGGVNPRRIIHFACDELRRGDLQRLVRSARDVLTHGVVEPRYWFLDEITGVPEWPEAIKWLRDNTALIEDCVVLGGSSARGLAEAQKQLAGRRGGAKDSDRLRRVGGFPRAVSDQIHHGHVQADFIDDLWNVAAGEALRRSATTPGQMGALLDRLARSLGTPLAVESARSDMGVASPHTALARIEDLILAYLIWPCHLSDGRAPRLSARSKYYFVDPLLARLAVRPEDVVQLSQASTGSLVAEGAVRSSPVI